MATHQLSVRLDPDALARLDKQSRRAGRSRSALARTLLDEGLRMEEHPGIVFRDGPAGRRAGLRDGMDVWEAATVFRTLTGDTEQRIRQAMKLMDLRRDQVEAIARYYAEYRDEVDRWIRRNEEEAEQAEGAWRAAHSPRAVEATPR